ncbi:KH domain-containing protein At4g18375 isoform X1 [Populus alba]|uniref:KH domain-containing protein n=1 Tax=Populus alba TaxID=43335 RepID=A0A4U5PSS1_POPAL|nr:RNA-binding KH domain-containing protein RCF3-like isoform X1 [Populus alba]TKS00448.1 KH domain-containing protein [Populus alba]
MDGNRRKYFKKPGNNLFKRKGVSSSRKGKWSDSHGGEEFSGDGDTVYRILCPSRKIGGVIGKGGNIVKALREETQSKITVADSVQGSDERVIIIYSSSDKPPRKMDGDEGLAAGNGQQEAFEAHCAAQDALLKVHDRIVEEDLFGGMASDDDNDNNVVTARLLVPNNMVGCVLGKRGDVIQRLRSETGANIRVLPADHLPSCAMDTDELVQISGKPAVAKRALYEISILLHQNPRKDKLPSVPMPYGGRTFHPPSDSMANMLPPGNPMWPHRNSTPHSMPWMGEYGNHPSEFGPGGFNGVPPGHGREPSAEFSVKILCSTGKIGGVIGKGGSNVKVVQQETGASIHVEDASAESEERAIRVSAFEGLWNPRSQTIDAILQLQDKTSDFSEKGMIITRLLVPSSKVGCILGQGGQVINEMRRRLQADIRVYPKNDKPKCASDDEELVQISGNYGVAKDALAEIASRLRARTLRDANAGTEPGPVGPVPGFGPARNLPGRGPQPSGMMAASSSGGYEPLRGGRRDYEPQSYPVPPAATGYPSMNRVLEADNSRSMNRVLEANNSLNGMNSVMRSGGRDVSITDEFAGRRAKLQDPHYGSSEVENHGSSEHLIAGQGFYQGFMASGGQNMSAHQGSYQNNATAQQSMNPQRDTYQAMSAQQSTYQSMNAQQSTYQNMNAHQSPYSMTAQQGVYTNINAPPSSYNNSAQQGTYQY